AEPIDRFRPRLLPYLQESVADLVDGAVPGDSGPLAVYELERIAQAAIAVHIVAHRRAFAAVRAAIDRTVPARFLAGPHAIGHLGDHGAAHRTVGADILSTRHAGARRWRRPGLGAAHARQRQCSEDGEASGGQAGTAQEVATVKRISALKGERFAK